VNRVARTFRPEGIDVCLLPTPSILSPTLSLRAFRQAVLSDAVPRIV